MKQVLTILLFVVSAHAQWQAVPTTGYPTLEAILNGKLHFQTVGGSPGSLACTAGKDVAFNSVAVTWHVCTVTGAPGTWVTIPFSVLVPANNLSDLANAVTARSNLGLGTAATAALASLFQLGSSNTITTGAQDFSAATHFRVPNASGYTPTTNGHFGYDTISNRFKGYSGAAVGTFFDSLTKTDSLQAGELCVDAGSTDTYACNLSPAITAYVLGTRYRFKAATANTGAASVNFSAVGALTLKKLAGGITTDLADNDIRAGQWVECVYDGANCQMVSQLGNVPSGGGDMTAAVYHTTGAGAPSSPCATAGVLYRNSSTTPYTVYMCPSAGGNWLGPFATYDATKSGAVLLGGLTSGSSGFAAADIAGTAILYVMPTTNGTAGQVLSDSGVTTCPTLAAGMPTVCHQLTFSAGGGSTSPLTTKGDIWVYGTANARLPVGTNGQALVADSTQTLGVKFASVGASVTGAPYTQSFTTQTSVALTHNLALSPVTAYVLECFDGSGVKIQPGSETATNLNTVTVTFSVAQTGSCTVATGGSGSPAVGSITGAGAAGHYPRSTGSTYADSAIQAGDIPNNAANTTGTAANVSGTPALPNGTTATTQTAGDNTTKLATTAFVSTAVAGGGGTSAVFAGSTADTVASSATPAFSFAAQSSKSPTVRKFTPVVSVTGPTFTNLTAGARALLYITTDGTHTWNWNSAVSDNVCNVWTQSAGTTIAEVFVDPDGTTLHGGACIGGPTGLLSLVTEGTPCASNPASGTLCVWADSTDHTVKAKDSSGNVSVLPRSAGSRTANQFCTHITTAGICSAAAIVAADLPATAVTPGAYTAANITVDAAGRITAAANGSVGSVGGSLGAGASGISITATAGSGGVTANLIAAKDTSNPTAYILPSSGGCGSGIAASTVSAAATFELYVVPGTVLTGVADNAITAGHVLVGGTSTPGRVRDSGQTSRSAIDNTTCVVGIAQANQASAGSTVLFRYDGVGTMGSQVINAGIANGTIDLTAKVTGALPVVNMAASTIASGTSVSLTAPRQYYICTGTCTVTPPVPAAGYEFCVRNANNVATVITLAAIGSSARYEGTAGTAYGTAGTGTFVSGGAAGDKVCIVGLDSTHYLTLSYNGTWTAN